MSVDLNRVSLQWMKRGCHGDPRADVYLARDSRGIPLSSGCEKCLQERLAGYRDDVLYGPTYEADEPIEAED